MSCLLDFNRNLQSPAGLLYLLPIVCFPIDLQFPPFSFVPLTFKKGTCLLLITVLLTSLSVLLSPALLKLAAFHASVSHAPFLAQPTHGYQTGSYTLFHTVSHGVCLRSILVMETKEELSIVFPSVRDCQLHICNTENDLDFTTIPAKE